MESTNAFVSDIDEETVEKIMYSEVDTESQILLMMGIGVFCENNCVQYEV